MCKTIKSEALKENFKIQLTSPILLDRLNILSAEYSISIEFLINVAIKHLIDDIDLVRSLRTNQKR